MILAKAGTVAGQITSPQSDATRQLDYPVATGSDPMYVFYQQEGENQPGSLVAGLPVAGPFDFVWTMYDQVADAFSIPVASESGVETSTVSGLDEGGYSVQITNGVDIDTSFIAWVMLDNLKVWTEKNSEGKLASFRSGCSDGNYVIIAGGVEVDTFYYYDPVSHDEVLFQNDFDILWTSDNPDLTIYNATNKDAMGSNYSNDPPFKDTWYILTATDSLGMVEDDSVLYDTKHTKAEFTVEYWDKVNKEWSEELGTAYQEDEGSMDAPLDVKYTNESLNGYQFTWVFVDTIEEATGIQTKEVEETMDVDYQPEFRYLMADEFYYPYLVSVSDAGCIDTFKLEDGIEVVGSELGVPNFFSPDSVFFKNYAISPNGDGKNEVFKLRHLSIKECKITIVDRGGIVVYRKTIDDMYAWEGWRGTILNTDRPAPEGQYYYVIEATGYDNKEYEAPNYFEQRKIDKQQGDTGNPDGQPDATEGVTRYVGWIYLFRENFRR